jgi:hypothetical protein
LNFCASKLCASKPKCPPCWSMSAVQGIVLKNDGDLHIIATTPELRPLVAVERASRGEVVKDRET